MAPDPCGYLAYEVVERSWKIWWNRRRAPLEMVWEDRSAGQALFIGGSGAADVADVLHAHGITHKLCVAGTETDTDICVNTDGDEDTLQDRIARFILFQYLFQERTSMLHFRYCGMISRHVCRFVSRLFLKLPWAQG